MEWSNYGRMLPVVAVMLFLVQCKNNEKIAKQPVITNNPCSQLTRGLQDNQLAFVAAAESDSKEIAFQKARKETVIQLVQYFQDEFIDDSREKFNGFGHPGRWEEFRKKWAETSYEVIGKLHNRRAFTHRQIIRRDSSGIFRAVDMLIVSHSWIRNHWQKTLKAADPAVFNTINQRKASLVQELEIPKNYPCENIP